MKVVADNPLHVASPRSTAAARQVYAARVEQFRGEAQRLRWRFGILWVVLTVAGVVLIGAVLAYLGLGVSFVLAACVAAVCVVVAFVATPLLLGTQHDIEVADRLAEINSHAVERVDRNWQALPVPNAIAPEAEPLVTVVPFTFTVALGSDVVGVTVTEVVPVTTLSV